jgi:chitin synthase
MHRIPSNDPSTNHTLGYNPHNPHSNTYRRQPPHQPPGSYEARPVFDSTISRFPSSTGSVLRRGKTLTRPERAVAPVPLINPRLSNAGLLNSSSSGCGIGGQLGSRGGSSGGNVSLGGVSTVGGGTGNDQGRGGINWWRVSSTIFTWYIPNVFLRRVMKLDSTATRQAWREKVTFCWIAVLLGALVGYITMGLQRTLCPEEAANSSKRLSRVGSTDSESEVPVLEHGFT